MIKAFIFDLDGTLANTLEDLKTSMNAMLSKFDFPLMTVDDILKNINSGALEFVTKCMPEEAQQNEKMIETCFKEYGDQYSLHYIEKTCLYDGIPECLSSLRASGMKMAVLSNKEDVFTKKIISTLIDDGIFDIVMGHVDGFPHKPDPKSALFIADKFGLGTDEIAFVGDSNVDMQTATNANMLAIGVTWGYRDVNVLLENGAKVIVNSAQEILNLI